MLLNDNEYSIQTIQEKTNITVKNLEKLSERDWSHFKKPQVLGLISIIEREFNVDLTSLKDEAAAYYKEHQEQEPECPIVLLDSATDNSGSGKLLSNIITAISICAVGYAGWYYYSNSQTQGHIDLNTTVEESNTGMFTDTINSAKKLLGSDKKDSNSSSAKKEETQASKDKEDTAQTVIVNSEQEQDKPADTAKSQEQNSTTAKKFDITTANEDSKVENNRQEEATQESNSTKAAANTESNSTEETNNSTVKGEVDNLLKELDENSSQQVADNNESNTTQSESATIADSNATQSLDTLPAITKATFKLKSKRLWLGIYSLTKHKKINKFIKRPYTLNIGDEKFAVVTGHNAFEIATDSATKRFAKKGKVYFTIDKDGIKQLNRREYRALTKRRAW